MILFARFKNWVDADITGENDFWDYGYDGLSDPIEPMSSLLIFVPALLYLVAGYLFPISETVDRYLLVGTIAATVLLVAFWSWRIITLYQQRKTAEREQKNG